IHVEFLYNYGLFLAKTLTLVLAFGFVVFIIAASAARQRHHGKNEGNIAITRLNDEYDRIKEDLRQEILEEDVLKAELKAEKHKEKEERKAKRKAPATEEDARKRVYVLDFDGDPRASAVEELRHCVTGVIAVARPQDEVLLKLESPGGMVH